MSAGSVSSSTVSAVGLDVGAAAAVVVVPTAAVAVSTVFATVSAVGLDVGAAAAVVVVLLALPLVPFLLLRSLLLGLTLALLLPLS